MAKCLRCGAGNEWIQGKVKDEPALSDFESQPSGWISVDNPPEWALCVTGPMIFKPGMKESDPITRDPPKDIYFEDDAPLTLSIMKVKKVG